LKLNIASEAKSVADDIKRSWERARPIEKGKESMEKQQFPAKRKPCKLIGLWPAWGGHFAEAEVALPRMSGMNARGGGGFDVVSQDEEISFSAGFAGEDSSSV
jgi:hypothetical protein